MRRRLLAAVPLSALVLLAGCGGVDTEQAGSSSSPSTATATSAPASTGAADEDTADDAAATGGSDPTADASAEGSAGTPVFSATTEADTGQAQPGEGPTVVTALRVGAHDGFDRVVFEVSGSAVPGWDVAYTDTPTAEGSGEAVDVPGAAYLRVVLTGVTNPYEAPDVPEVPRGAAGSAAGDVAGVWYDSVLEGQALAYIGLPAQAPFRVYALTGPSRVVVEVQ